MHAENHKVALTKLLELDFNKSHLLHKHQQTMLVLVVLHILTYFSVEKSKVRRGMVIFPRN